MRKDHPAELIRKEADIIESGLKLQMQGLELLRAELQGLAGLLKGATQPGPATDAETEAEFDNLPV